MSSQGVTGLIGAGLPLLLLWLKLAAVFARMAKRKGLSNGLAFFGAFPAWALFFAAWLLFRPDAHPALSEDEPPDREQE